MHFKRLRLQGFKSFVEPTELIIDQGMTGIVGPNGCGKSNLVEALKWVMGETSPKRMRGTEMDDVIFAGTTTRPSRNLAEVQLHLDNSARTAAAEFNHADDLAIVRQIERGSGSDYRVNGKPVRQRDVQLLFADHSTGAHSTSVVGQGQIDALIRAKPQDRRQILEEAAGTSGLQSRRHEAELKLKGAELNMTRADDVLKAYDTQLRSLKTQIKQASRYRNLADHIRRTEAALLNLRWNEAVVTAETVRQTLLQTEQKVNDLMLVVTQGTTERTEIAARLPELRQKEAAAAVIVQKLTLAREQLDAEARRIAGETAAHQNLLNQAKNDLKREQERQTDGSNALSRLNDEEAQIATRIEEITGILPTATQAWEAIKAEVATLDAELHALVQATATAEARQKALMQEKNSLNQRAANLKERRDQLQRQKEALVAEIATRPDLSLATSMVEACETELAKRQEQGQQAEQALRDADQVQMQKREEAQKASTGMMRLKAEADAISSMLQHDRDSKAQNASAQAVIDLITVAPGLEQALAVALGEALTASLDPETARYWRELPPMDSQPLPNGTVPLANSIQAPAALGRSLSQIGLVENGNDGNKAAADLLPGQILVSRDGWAWRWDGFTVSPNAKTTTALRLQQRNRLNALLAEIEVAQKALTDADAEKTAATTAFKQCQDLDQQTRQALKAAFAALNDARNLYARQERDAAASGAKLSSLEESMKLVVADIAENETRLAEVATNEKDLPNIEGQKMEMASKRATLAEKRSLQAQRQNECDQLTREQKRIGDRKNSIVQDKEAWHNRMENAAAQTTSLEERITNLQAQLAELATKPEAMATERADILDCLTDCEAKRAIAADAVITTEQQLQAVEFQLKQNESSLSSAREDRVRNEAAVQASEEHFTVLRERMTEKLNCTPEELPALAKAEDGETTSNAYELEQTLARFARERDNMGPVNLRAEVEAETTQNDITKLQQEKDDLTAAIAKLRQGIGQLNREARDRLQVAFVSVNERFETLFKRLFNGGTAHLELINNEDPMNAGLEIVAAPPGKKQQVLSLLSGGERTLTALALLFAVFQTTPSPICVLDEAEAALDESNIGRFCDLIESIANETGTRFLIITHHRLTMARMDRLYGVTMSEKGVSQLVSVNLNAAVALRDGATAADVKLVTEALQQVQAA